MNIATLNKQTHITAALVVTAKFIAKKQDVDIILATPVHYDLEDIVAWHYDKRGCEGSFQSLLLTKFRMTLERRGMSLDT